MNNKNKFSIPVSQEMIDLVWEKAVKVPGYDADLFRKDKYGSWITKNMYSETNEYIYFGWGIDYVVSEEISNVEDGTDMLQPLNWENIEDEEEKYTNNLNSIAVN